MKQKRYIHDLREMQSLAERNYASAFKLLGLLARDFKVGDSSQLSMGEHLSFDLKVLTDAPYTTDIEVVQKSQGPKYLTARFVVRLYHDMQLAEMLSSQGLERFAVNYEQPNPKMLQRDEKRQINHFLADWLRLCFKRGRWQDVYLAGNGNGSGFDFQVKDNNDRL